jgi:hypothetical protein
MGCTAAELLVWRPSALPEVTLLLDNQSLEPTFVGTPRSAAQANPGRLLFQARNFRFGSRADKQ